MQDLVVSIRYPKSGGAVAPLRPATATGAGH
jgi:hypothetical protein